MTIGIYLLKFGGTDKVYVGQSINIENRFRKHLHELRSNTHCSKLQDAYKLYGEPSLEILLECRTSELNNLEKEAIIIFDSFKNGFNTLPEAGNPILHGEDVGTAKYTNDKYKHVLKLLVQKSPSYTKREIASICDVSIYTVRHIAALESHTWLKEEMPEEYGILENIKNNSRYYHGKQYPLIQSPDGTIHEVVHVTNFAKEHGLLQSKLTEVLRGTRNVHKGWRLA